MSQSIRGLLEVNKRETVMLSRVTALAHTRNPVLSYQILHKELHSHKGKMPRREKQRDPPFSLSFPCPLAIVFSSPLQRSTNMHHDQRICGVRSRGWDERVWKTRWDSAAAKLRCQSSIGVSGPCIPVVCRLNCELTWKPSVCCHTSRLVVTAGCDYV